MSDDGLPVRVEPPVSEGLQQRGINFLQGLVGSGRLDLDRFQEVLDALLGARTHSEFASVVRSLPPVEFTPPTRRRQEPLEIVTSMGEVRLEGRWQVSRLTEIDIGMGAVVIDLREAEFDGWDVEIVAHTKMGSITVIVPPASKSDKWAGAARSATPSSRQSRAFRWCGSAPLVTWAKSVWCTWSRQDSTTGDGGDEAAKQHPDREGSWLRRLLDADELPRLI